MTISLILSTLLSGDQAAPVNNDGDGPVCEVEYVTAWETQYQETEEEECKDVHKKVPIKVSKLVSKTICDEEQEKNVVDPYDNEFSCHTEHVKIWEYQYIEDVEKECETVHQKVPVQVSNLVKKIVCHELDEVIDDVFDTADDVVDTIDVTVFDTNYDNYENKEDLNLPPNVMELPCWSGSL